MINGAGTLGIGVAIGFAVQGISSVMMAQRQLTGLISTFKNASNEAKNMAIGLGLIVAGLVAMKAASAGFKFMAGATDTYAELETQMLQLQSIRQISDEERDALQETIVDWSLQYPYAANEIAEAAKTISRAGFDVATTMAMTEAAMRAAVVGETDVVTATDSLIAAFKVFGFTADDSTEVVDILSKATTQAWLEMDDFSAAFSRFGPIARSTDQDMETMIVMLGTLTDTGLSATRAGTMLKMMLTKLQAPTSAASQAMAALDVQTRETMADGTVHVRSLMDIMADLSESELSTDQIDAFLVEWTGSMEEATDIQEAQAFRSIFGQRALVGASAFETAQATINGVLYEGNELLEYRLAELQDHTGFSQDYLETQMQSWENMKTMLENTKTAVMLALGEAFMPMLKTVLEWTTSIFGAIAGFFRSHPGLAKLLGWILGGLSVLTFIAGLLAILGGIAMLVMGLMSGVAGAAILMGLAVIGWIISILIVIALVYLLIKYWDEIWAAVGQFFAWLGGVIWDVISAIGEVFWSIISFLVNLSIQFHLLIWDIITFMWSMAISWVMAAVHWVVTAFNNAIAWIVNLWESVWSAVGNAVDAFVSGVIRGFAAILNFVIDGINKINPFKDIEHVTWGNDSPVRLDNPEEHYKGSYDFAQDQTIRVHKHERLIKDGDTDYQEDRGLGKSKGTGVNVGTINMTINSTGDENLDARKMYRKFLEIMRSEQERAL